MAEDRDKWRKYVHGVSNPRIEDGWSTEQYGTIYLLELCNEFHIKMFWI